MLGKRPRTSLDEEAVIKLTSVFTQIKTRYEDALLQLKEETKDDVYDVFTKWCGNVINVVVKETMNASETQNQLIQALRNVVEAQKMQGEMQP